MTGTTLEIATAQVFEPLLEPSRYKGIHGGRGSGKSHFFAELMVETALLRPGLRCLCVREVQRSLKESAKRLIEDKIVAMGVGAKFEVLQSEIKTPGNGVITFTGMQDHTAESVKSYEGYDIAWIEEARSLSARSLTLLRPTIRKDGSEIWASWNPGFSRDPIDELLRGPNPPPNAVVVEANWSDNPWFPDTLNAEREYDKEHRAEQYGHIWEGEYAKIYEGAYYADQLEAARRENRIGWIGPDPLMTIRAYWDIGGTGSRADATAIWVVQFIGKEIRVLNYYEAQGQQLADHAAWLRYNGYDKALCILPHDGANHEKVVRVTYESALRSAGFLTRVLPNAGGGAAMRRVEAGRRRFPIMFFNEATTQGGREALGAYHEKRDEARGIGLGPEHDWCLAAGTQVLTPTGWRSVQEIEVHNQVLTPYGPRRILRSGIVRETSQWVTIKGIRCTPEHRFFTSRGLVEAGRLSSRDELWTRDSLGLRILALWSATLCLGLKAAITSATPEAVGLGVRFSFTGWCMRLCMVKYRQAMKSITLMRTRLTTTPPTLWPLLALNTAAATSQSLALPALAGSAAPSLAVTKPSERGAARIAGASTTPGLNGNAAPAYNLTVDVDECYFVRGSDGLAYLVSNSSHAADAFGMMALDYEEPTDSGWSAPIKTRIRVV